MLIIDESNEFSNRIDDVWKRSNIIRVNRELSSTKRYVDILNGFYINGGAEYHCFGTIEKPGLLRAISEHQLEKYDFFFRFWLQKEVRKSLPYNVSDQVSEQVVCYFTECILYKSKVFKKISPFYLAGYLAKILHEGGAYTTDYYSSASAKELGDLVSAELLEKDLMKSMVFYSNEGWSDFFSGYGIWDHTFLIINPVEELVHVIVASDVD